MAVAVEKGKLKLASDIHVYIYGKFQILMIVDYYEMEESWSWKKQRGVIFKW